MGLMVTPLPGEDAEAGVAKTLATDPEDLKKFKYLMLEKYTK